MMRNELNELKSRRLKCEKELNEKLKEVRELRNEIEKIKLEESQLWAKHFAIERNKRKKNEAGDI